MPHSFPRRRSSDLYNGQTAPRGWTWQDMCNYYGAGVSALNWRENSVGINFTAGASPEAPTRIGTTTADLSYLQLVNETTTGNRGTGDQDRKSTRLNSSH